MSLELGQVWAYRARREREATRRFQRLAHEFEAVGAGFLWATRAQQASLDEARHELLCARFGQLHGAAVAAGSESYGSVAPHHFPRSAALLYDVVATCCVAETINAALLTAEVAAAKDADLKALTTTLLRDEVQHARLGWAYLGDVAGRGDVGVLTPHVEQMVFGAAADEATEAPQLLSPRRSQNVLYETLHEVVLPGLAAHGLHTKARNRHARRR